MAEGVVAGIDWASEVHVACVVDADGAVTGRFSFTHDVPAIRAMVRRLRAAKVAGVAIERGDGPVVEELLEPGLAAGDGGQGGPGCPGRAGEVAGAEPGGQGDSLARG